MEGKKVYLVLLILAIIETIVCLTTENLWILRIFLVANIFCIYAASWDLLGGYCGQVSIGHALFFGGAGYVSSILNLNLGIPLVASAFAGIAAAVLLAFIIGRPILRLRGPYLALGTMVIPLILITIITLFPLQLGGEGGISGFAFLAGGNLKSQFYLVLCTTLVCVWIMIWITRGNLGLIMKAIREDEFGARAAGVDLAKYKSIAFVLSALFASIAGVLFIHHLGSVGPSVLMPITSIYPIIMAMIGGSGTIIGPLIGAYIIMFLEQYLQVIPTLRVILYSIATILVLRFAPAGIMGFAGRLRWKT